jgi:flagellar hook protein FlgE
MVNNVMNTAQTAINAYSTMLDNTASNVANVNTQNYQPVETIMKDAKGGGVSASTTRAANADQVDLSKEVVDLIIAENGIKANAKVIKTAQTIQKSVIDMLA